MTGLTLETLSLRGGGIQPRGPCVSEAQMAGRGGTTKEQLPLCLTHFNVYQTCSLDGFCSCRGPCLEANVWRT